jgi:hypothetical protein
MATGGMIVGSEIFARMTFSAACEFPSLSHCESYLPAPADIAHLTPTPGRNRRTGRIS